MCSLLRVIKKKSKKVENSLEEEENSLRNGSRLFEALIASTDGKYRNPIRIFSAKELKKATNNYDKDQIILGAFYILYRGSLENRSISVKTYTSYGNGDHQRYESQMNMFINDVVTSSRMNYHKNVLKLLGCCLETPIPIVVYEFITSNLTLSRLLRGVHHLESDSQFSWESRLRIANEIANAVTYLHTAFSRPIINRNITSRNILLYQQCIPKLQDFSLSVIIPLGETHVEADVAGTFGFIAPECANTGCYTEKSDVFSFGILLLELLSGKSAPQDLRVRHTIDEIDRNEIVIVTGIKDDYIQIGIENISKIVDPQILKEGAIDELMQQQLEAFLELTKRCIQFEKEKRPTMIDVAKALKCIQRGTFEELKAKFKDLDKDLEDLSHEEEVDLKAKFLQNSKGNKNDVGSIIEEDEILWEAVNMPDTPQELIKQQSKKTFTQEEIKNESSL